MVRKHPSGWKSNRSTTAMRVAAVVCVIMALTTADEKFTPAYYYREQYPDYAKEVHGDLNRFCKLHHKNFTANGTVATPKHGGRPSNVPHAVAFHASTIFKAGKVVKAYPSADSKRKVDVHVWWTSIEVACQENDTLRQLCTDYNITPKRLLKYMKWADPDLVRRRIDVKLDLTKIQKQRRKAAAAALWQKYQSDPDMLQRIYFIDECKFWMSDLAGGSVKVYCDAHDENVHAVLPCKWMRKGKDAEPVKLHFVCAVNAVHGPVYCKFVTGTTDNKDHAGNLNVPYMLKDKPTQQAKSMTQLEFVHCMMEIKDIANQQQAQRGTTPLYIFDNPSVHLGKDGLQMLVAGGINEDQLLHIAPYSPDFNKPIEHAFGSLKAAFRNYLYNSCQLGGADVKPRDLQHGLYNTFMKITAASVMADVLKLPDLWNMVRSRKRSLCVCRDGKQRRGTAGDYPRKDQR